MLSLSPWHILQSVLPMYGLILLGACLRRARVLQPEADGSMMKLVIHCLYPLLIIDKILASQAVRESSLILWTIPTGFIIIALSLLLAKLGAATARIPQGPERNTFAMTCGIQNYGFAAVPIIMALFHQDLLGVQFVHSLGVEIALWTLGIAVLRGRRPTNLRSLLAPPVLAVLIGLALVYTGLGDLLLAAPALQPGVTMMQWLGACSFPVALMLVGATLADNIRQARPTLPVGTASIALRLLLLPALILLAVWLIPFPPELATLLVVQAAMPSAVMPIVLSRLYGGHPATAVQVVMVTQLLGIITIPLWITLGLRLL